MEFCEIDPWLMAVQSLTFSSASFSPGVCPSCLSEWPSKEVLTRLKFRIRPDLAATADSTQRDVSLHER
jgi:hypothetical protein